MKRNPAARCSSPTGRRSDTESGNMKNAIRSGLLHLATCRLLYPLQIVILSIALLLLVGSSAAGPISLNLKVTRHQLKNGLEILAMEDHTLPIVSYYTFFKVGSRNEQIGKTGLSHLIEHMMFNGARRYGPKAFDQALESNGGNSNAFTTEDMTAYYEDFPGNRLELVIDMESDRMAHLALTQESLASEREVVKEERRAGVDNTVYGHVMEVLASLSFTAHPYRWPVVGWMADLDAITIDDCWRHFRAHYAPNNAVIVVVGDFQTEKVVDLIRRYYESIQPASPAQASFTSEPVQYGERRATLYKFAELPALAIGYRAASTNTDDLFALDVLQMILAHGESSRLYRRLVYTEQRVINVSASFPWMIAPGLFTLYATMKPDEDHARIEGVIYEELDRLKTEPVSDHELRKAKNVLQASLVRDMETNNGKAEKIGTCALLFGDWSILTTMLDRYESITADDILRMARTYFAERTRNVVLMKPEAPR